MNMNNEYLKKLKVRYENFELELISQSFYKREDIQKPYFEFDYFIFDAKLIEYDVDGVPIGERYLEIEYNGKGSERLYGFITINEIITSQNVYYFSLQNIITDYLLDYENLQSRYKFDKEIAESLHISNSKFSFSILLNELYEKIEDYYVEELNKPSTSKFLYEPFFFKAGESILVSKMGEGKTLWVLSMLYRLQNGIPLISFENENLPIFSENYIEPCNAVYLAFEGNIVEILEKKEEIKNWIKKEAALLGKSEVKDFYIQFLTGDIIKRVNRRKIRKILSILKPKFIVIDSVTSAFLSFSSVDKNHLIYSFIRETFISKGIGVMLLMHPAKQDLRDELNIPRGSIHHLAIPRAVWGLEQAAETEDGFIVSIKSVKDNLGLKKYNYEYHIRFYSEFTEDDREEKICEIKLKKVEDENIQQKRVREKILEYMKKEGKEKITVEEIVKKFLIKENTVRKTLRRMEKSGILVKSGKAYYIKKEDESLDNDKDIPF